MTASRSIPATRQRLALLLGLVLAACLVVPATAQEVPFRLVHQGNLLPEGTAVVVLEEAVDPSAAGRIQPRFIDRDDYPRDPAAVSFRDTLNARGRTTESYPRTQSARTLYFIYARTPDDTIYWSYSAQEDQLKFDVVATGAMSVAPAPDDAAEELRGRFFTSDAPVADAPPAAADAAPDTAPGETPATAQADPRPSDDAIEAPTDPAPDTDAAPAEASDAAADPAAPASDTAPAPLTIALGLLSAVLLVALLLLYRRYRALKDGVSDEDVMQAELAAAREQLREYRHLEAEHKALQDKYETVRQHCDTLLAQHDRLRAQLQETQTPSSEAPDQSPRA
ncbi:MAG: hypothetical protein GVY12_16075 [Bacteroidetes bacterium]|jgi:hypothetical protein|nr:hypothetical protein [Bacteroidota bacterium]